MGREVAGIEGEGSGVVEAGFVEDEGGFVEVEGGFCVDEEEAMKAVRVGEGEGAEARTTSVRGGASERPGGAGVPTRVGEEDLEIDELWVSGLVTGVVSLVSELLTLGVTSC